MRRHQHAFSVCRQLCMQIMHSADSADGQTWPLHVRVLRAFDRSASGRTCRLSTTSRGVSLKSSDRRVAVLTGGRAGVYGMP